MKYKLKNIDGLSEDDLKEEIRKGGKFHVFRYYISIALLPLKRYSPAIFVRAGEDYHTYARKYNWISLLLGAWNPFCLIPCIRSIIANGKGGVDMTPDIKLNIKLLDYSAGEIELEKTTFLFDKVEKQYLKEMKTALVPWAEKTPAVREIYVGYFINTEGAPFYMIGLGCEEADFDPLAEGADTALRTIFQKHVEFEFMHMDHPELGSAMAEQGDPIWTKLIT